MAKIRSDLDEVLGSRDGRVSALNTEIGALQEE
jgi:hypothetical protein